MAKFLKIGSLAALALAACSGFAQGHYVEYGLNLSIGNTYIEEYRQGEQSQGLLNFTAFEEGLGFVSGRANVGYGVNKAAIELVGSNADNPIDFAYGFASSRYFDWFVIDSPGLTGTSGSFTTTLYIEGTGAFELSESWLNTPDLEVDAFWHGVINLTAEGVADPITGGTFQQSAYFAGEWYKAFGETEVVYQGDPLNTLQQEATFQFVYGEPVFVDTFIQTFIDVDNQASLAPGTINARVDLGNSAYWGGIRSIRNASGQSVNGVLFESGSGFNYLEPVPEPASFVALGLGALALARRRRGRQ